MRSVKFNKDASTLLDGFGVDSSRADALVSLVDGKEVMDSIDTVLKQENFTVAEKLVVLIGCIGSSLGAAEYRRKVEAKSEQVFASLPLQ